MQITGVDIFHNPGGVGERFQIDDACRHRCGQRGVKRQRKLVVVGRSASRCPALAGGLIQRQQEDRRRTGCAELASCIRYIVVDASRHHGKPAVGGGGSGRSAGAHLDDTRLAEHVTHVVVTRVRVIFRGELPQNLARAERRRVGHIQGKHAATTAPGTGHQHRTPVGRRGAAANLGVANDRCGVHIGLMFIARIGQGTELGTHPARDISKQLAAVGRIEGMQHAIVGTCVNRFRPVGLCRGIGAEALAKCACGRRRAHIDDTRIGDITERVVTHAEGVCFLALVAAQVREPVLPKTVVGSCGAVTVEVGFQRGFDGAGREVRGRGRRVVSALANHDVAVVTHQKPARQLLVGRPGGVGADRDIGIAGSTQGNRKRKHITPPAAGVERCLVNRGARLRQAGTRGRGAGNVALRRRGFAKDFLECRQHAACLALQEVRLRFARARGILPNVVVRRTGVVVEGVALGVVWLRRVLRRLGLEAAVLRRGEVLVVVPASHRITRSGVLVHVEEERFHAQARALLAGLCRPAAAADVVRVCPVGQAIDLRATGVGVSVCGVRVARGLRIALTVHVGQALLFLKCLHDGNPALDVGHVVGEVGCRHAVVRRIGVTRIPGVDVADQGDVALEAGVIRGGAAATTVWVKLTPVFVDGEVVVKHPLRGRGKVQVGHGARTGRQALQIAQGFVVKLAGGVVLLVTTRNGAGAAELVQVVDHPAHTKGRVTVRVVLEDAGDGVPFRGRIAGGGGVFDAIGVVGTRPHILHGGTQHAAVATGHAPIRAERLLQRVAKRRQTQLVVVLLDRAARLVLAIGVPAAQAEVAVVHQVAAGIGSAHLNTGIKEAVCVQPPGRAPGTTVWHQVTRLGCAINGVAERGVAAVELAGNRRPPPTVVGAVPRFLQTGSGALTALTTAAVCAGRKRPGKGADRAHTHAGGEAVPGVVGARTGLRRAEVNPVEYVGNPDAAGAFVVGCGHHGLRHGAGVVAAALEQLFAREVGVVPEARRIATGQHSALQDGQVRFVDIAVAPRQRHAQHVNGRAAGPVKEVAAERVGALPVGRGATDDKALVVRLRLARGGRFSRAVLVRVAHFGVVVADVFCAGAIGRVFRG